MSYIALGLKTKNVREVIAHTGTMYIGKTLCVREALIMLLQILCFEILIRLSNGANILAPEGFDEPILLGAIATLNASFGLWRVGKNHFNTQRPHSASNIGQLVLGIKDAAVVNIQRFGNAEALTIDAQCCQDIGTVFRRRKTQEDPARGIIDCVEQTAGRTASLEPIVRTAIKLYKLTNRTAPLAFATMLPATALEMRDAIVA